MSDHESTSLEMAGGCAVGFTGTIEGYNADAEARFAKALLSVGKWVVAETGTLLGHIKAAIVKEDGSGITLNLTDLENGVEHHGTLGPQDKVKFSFMTAVVDVDEHELKHAMWHAIEDTGLDYKLDEPVCHCHDHDHHHHHDDDECCCGHDHDHDHDHHHHHDDGECCCGHDHHYHHDDGECCCGHDHDHHHHHDDGECCCHDEEVAIAMTGTFVDMKPADVLGIIDSLGEVFDWVQEKNGMLDLIEITIAPEGSDWAVLTLQDKDVTLIQGKAPSSPKAFFRLEACGRDVNEHDLIHRIFHAIEDADIEFSINGESHCHCHDHGECGCGCCDDGHEDKCRDHQH